MISPCQHMTFASFDLIMRCAALGCGVGGREKREALTRAPGVGFGIVCFLCLFCSGSINFLESGFFLVLFCFSFSMLVFSHMGKRDGLQVHATLPKKENEDGLWMTTWES